MNEIRYGRFSLMICLDELETLQNGSDLPDFFGPLVPGERLRVGGDELFFERSRRLITQTRIRSHLIVMLTPEMIIRHMG